MQLILKYTFHFVVETQRYPSNKFCKVCALVDLCLSFYEHICRFDLFFLFYILFSCNSFMQTTPNSNQVYHQQLGVSFHFQSIKSSSYPRGSLQKGNPWSCKLKVLFGSAYQFSSCSGQQNKLKHESQAWQSGRIITNSV